MAKLTLNDLSTLANPASAIALINANSAATEAALELTLSRDGTSPNQMGSDIDLDGNDLLNAGGVYADRLFINGELVTAVSIADDTTVVNVRDFGAVGDGITDDTGAVRAAWDAVRAIPNPPRLHFPSGTYRLSSLDTPLEVFSGAVITGDGMDCTKIKFDAAVGVHLFYRAPNLALLTNVEFRDLHVEGGHGDGGDYSQISSYPFLLTKVNGLKMSRVKVTKSRVMAMAFRGCYGVDVHDCVVQYCARDGINTGDCDYVSICNNRVEFCDDDAIAGATQYYGQADRGYVISGNIVRFAQGIRMLGAKSVSITGNTLEFVMSQGISVDAIAPSTGELEGINGSSGVVISGNIIKNCIDRTIVDGLNDDCPYIVINGNAAQAGTLATIPGENNTATGTITPLYPYFENSNSNNANLPIPGNYNIIVSDNVMTRDVDASGLLSALGFGTFYTRNGTVDPTLTEAAMRQHGVRAHGGTLRNAHIRGNAFMGINAALSLDPTARIINGSFSGNTVFDCTSGVSFDSGNALHQGLRITDNVFDIDPLLTHANRGANGTYLAYGNPTAILMQSANGVGIGGNVFKNCGRICDASVMTGSILQGTRLQLLADNYFECDPTSEGFSASNKGIGEVPRGPGFVARIVDCDPASATYGTTLNFCPTSSSTMPTAGKFVHGHFVRNNNPAITGTGGSQYMIIGWIRATTGSGHVLNTDWREARALTGT